MSVVVGQILLVVKKVLVYEIFGFVIGFLLVSRMMYLMVVKRVEFLMNKVFCFCFFEMIVMDNVVMKVKVYGGMVRSWVIVVVQLRF